MNMTTFDFGYGNGPVPAHKHVNGGGWVADTAKVADTCYVGPNARVFGYARMHGNARMSGNAMISGNAKMCNNAWMSGHTRMFSNAMMSGNTRMSGNAKMTGNSRMFGNATMSGFACMFDNTNMYDNARMSGFAMLCNDALMCDHALAKSSFHIKFGVVTTDLSKDKVANISAQCNLGVFEDYVYCYKRVNKDLSSEYDCTFKYPSKGKVSVKNYNRDPNVSCDTGMHFSHLTFYPKTSDNHKILFAKVHINDVIAVQEGKIRVREAHILGVCD